MKNIVLLIALALAFCLTEVTLIYFLPLAKTDFDVWLKYFFAKDAVYDTMFFIFSLLLFWNLKIPLQRAISVFLVVVTGGSFMDKVIFNQNLYLLSDVALIASGIVVSIICYIRWKSLGIGHSK